ncbi:Imm10 family immunity protein [Streptomyces sp. NPDC060085]|uniref:Imm10 family immunity protein n=1 Tax=Streptomyces sp. NPDC060085 TaxID=3347054 RepID=UPI00365CAF68
MYSDQSLPAEIFGIGEIDDTVFVTDESGNWVFSFQGYFDEMGEVGDRLGMDTYCLVVDPGQRTCYGGVVECLAVNSELRLVLTEEAADALKVPPNLSFTLRLPVEELAILKAALSKILTSGRSDAIPEHLEFDICES